MLWDIFICKKYLNVVICTVEQLRETRKTVRDTQAGIEKMALGRHINERGHVITKQRDKRSGNIEEHQDFLNIDEGRTITLVYPSPLVYPCH